MVSDLTSKEDSVQLWELGLPTLWISPIYFQQKKVGLTLLPRALLSVEAESNSEVFSFGPDTPAGN